MRSGYKVKEGKKGMAGREQKELGGELLLGISLLRRKKKNDYRVRGVGRTVKAFKRNVAS